ncbi:ribosomal RNA small subunit methyltransferase nep1-like [Plakobranchus ocellatus]|uniref:Ribosomal RNA small subunit methyltransferase nep1-like n=1 Tax=Plakobranchus ocellatus TaxID=259542 RepID=A0AAV4CLZ7_9GAST|nr:ribosomal RNA small subunit methyltransferase nep1-like [Plakobranchus ocellatus]
MKTLVWTVMTYRAEGWTIKKKQEKKINSAEMWFYRRLLRISWRERRTDQIQLLDKLSIRASDGPQKLLKVIKNPVSDHLPTGCLKVAMSYNADKIIDVRDVAPKEKPAVFVIGAMAHGSVNPDYTEASYSISNYPLSAAITCSKVCSAFEEVWGIK